MRFFVTGEQNRERVLNTIVLLFLAYMILQWLSFGLMFFDRMTLNPESIRTYYLGSEALFKEPRSYKSLLEVSHAHLFSMGMLAVTLTHLLLFTEVSARLKTVLSLLVFFSAIGDELSGWLIRFVHPSFAWLKLGLFLTLEGSLLTLIIVVTYALLKQRRKLLNKRREVRPKHRGHA